MEEARSLSWAPARPGHRQATRLGSPTLAAWPRHSVRGPTTRSRTGPLGAAPGFLLTLSGLARGSLAPLESDHEAVEFLSEAQEGKHGNSWGFGFGVGMWGLRPGNMVRGERETRPGYGGRAGAHRPRRPGAVRGAAAGPHSTRPANHQKTH